MKPCTCSCTCRAGRAERRRSVIRNALNHLETSQLIRRVPQNSVMWILCNLVRALADEVLEAKESES